MIYSTRIILLALFAGIATASNDGPATMVNMLAKVKENEKDGTTTLAALKEELLKLRCSDCNPDGERTPYDKKVCKLCQDGYIAAQKTNDKPDRIKQLQSEIRNLQYFDPLKKETLVKVWSKGKWLIPEDDAGVERDSDLVDITLKVGDLHDFLRTQDGTEYIKFRMVPEEKIHRPKELKYNFGMLFGHPKVIDDEKFNNVLISNYIADIGQELMRYPKLALQRSGLKEIVLCHQIGDGSAAGVACVYSGEGRMILTVRARCRRWTLHHELGHFLHYEVVKENSGRNKQFTNDTVWKKLSLDLEEHDMSTDAFKRYSGGEVSFDEWKLNPKNLKRGSGSYMPEAYPCVSFYGFMNAQEDIAELHALAMMQGPDFWKETMSYGPIIKNKWKLHQARLLTLFKGELETDSKLNQLLNEKYTTLNGQGEKLFMPLSTIITTKADVRYPEVAAWWNETVDNWQFPAYYIAEDTCELVFVEQVYSETGEACIRKVDGSVGFPLNETIYVFKECMEEAYKALPVRPVDTTKFTRVQVDNLPTIHEDVEAEVTDPEEEKSITTQSGGSTAEEQSDAEDAEELPPVSRPVSMNEDAWRVKFNTLMKAKGYYFEIVRTPRGISYANSGKVSAAGLQRSIFIRVKTDANVFKKRSETDSAVSRVISDSNDVVARIAKERQERLQKSES